MFWLLKAEFIKLKRNKFFYATIIISLVIMCLFLSKLSFQEHILFWINYIYLLFFPIWISIISYIVMSNDEDKWSILYTYPIRSKYFLAKFICVFLVVLFQMLAILWIILFFWKQLINYEIFLSLINFSFVNLLIFVPWILFFMIFSQKLKFYSIIYAICTSIIIMLSEISSEIFNFFKYFNENWFLFPNYYNTKIVTNIYKNSNLEYEAFTHYNFEISKLFTNLFLKIDLVNIWIFITSIIILSTFVIIYYKNREIK